MDALKRGVSKVIVSIPTGGGKTFVCVKLSEIGRFKRVLFCVDQEELAEQAALAFLREKFDDSLINHIEEVGFIEYIRKGGILAGNDYKVGLIKADVFQPNGDVVICSLQTLHKRLHLLNPDDFDLVIVDECHIATANTIVKSLNFLTPKLLVGVSATPFRADGVSLGDVFDEIVYEYDILDGIRDGYLCEIDAVRVKTNIDIDGVKTKGGDLNEQQLSQTVDCLERNNLVAQSYLKYGKGRQFIGYSVDIAHALNLAEACQNYGINATAISSDEKRTGNRTQKVKDFKDGKYDIVFNAAVLVKGFDFPNLGGVIHACPTKSLVKWKQGTGRCTRLKDENYVKQFGQKAILIDIVDTTSRHNLINAFNLDKGIEPEKRTYITSENRNKLITARNAKIEAKHNKDERIQLLPIYTPKWKTNIKATIGIGEVEKKLLANMGYDVVNSTFTQESFREIVGSLPATSDQLRELKKWNFDVSQPITRSQASYSLWMFQNNKIKT